MDRPAIYVTKPSLPQLEELIPHLEQIWASSVVTNNGPFHQQLEAALCDYLGVSYVSLFSNATIALITAQKALGLKGEVITTPYSFVATSHSLLWNGIKPIFVDIDPVTLNLDPTKIESAITPNTTAILPVHVYGNPCYAEAIDGIAKRHKLKVIYDAAHAFGVNCHCGSVLNHGDLSVLSFHATKVFNTFEGGAVVCQDIEMKRHLDELKNFGFVNETSVTRIGINGKMNEFSAALGLVQLKHVDIEIEKRKAIDKVYRDRLGDIPGIRCHQYQNVTRANYGYFPIFVEDNFPLTRDQLYDTLKACGIHGRRYFYPLISEFRSYREMQDSLSADLSVSSNVAAKVICLPLYPTLSDKELDVICRTIKLSRKPSRVASKMLGSL